MMNGITRILTSNSLNNITSNTNSQVIMETTLKAIGRPGFILIDNDIDDDTKKYAAAKEFLYQATCLLVYAALVVPVFKKGSFKLAQKLFKPEEIGKFTNSKQYAHYLKLCDTTLNNRLRTLEKEIKGVYKTDNNGNKVRKLVKDEYDTSLVTELNKEKPDKFPILKGAVEFGNIIGSVFGLAIFAPQVSHLFIHPALNVLGFDKPKKMPAPPDEQKTLQTAQNLDKKA